MLKNTAALTAALAALAPGMVLAEASDFDLVEAKYLQGEAVDVDVDGWSIGGSLEINEEFFASASYGELGLDEDFPGVDLEGEEYRLGAGYIFGQNERGNFYGTLEYVNSDVFASAGGFTFSDGEDGYAIGLGTRFNVGAQAEVRLKLDYVDVGGSEVVPTAAFIYNFSDTIAGIIDYTNPDDAHAVGLGIRFYF